MKFGVVDVQGYVINNTFIAKELAIYDGKCLKSFLFKPIIKYFNLCEADRKIANFLFNNIHGISYSSGDFEYCEVKNILESNLNDFDVIFVKGHAKAEFLLKYLPFYVRIINLENSTGQVPNLGPTKDNCKNHVLKYCNCSIHNAHVLFDYIYNKLTV